MRLLIEAVAETTFRLNASTDEFEPPLHSKSHDHIARIWPDRGVDCHSVADCRAQRLLRSAIQTMAGRCHDGIYATHRSRDDSHRFIDLRVEYLGWQDDHSCEASV